MWGDFDGARPYFGIYGKLGERKGSFALLEALARLKREGIDVGLVALAHGRPAVEKAFRARARALELAGPHPADAVPAALARAGISARLPRGVLSGAGVSDHVPHADHSARGAACGDVSRRIDRGVAQAAATMAGLDHGYGCVAVKDVTDVATLARQLAAIATDPAPRAAVGARGRIFAQRLQQGIAFPRALEQILGAAAARRSAGAARLRRGDDRRQKGGIGETDRGRFPLTRLAIEVLTRDGDRDGGGDRFPTPDEQVDLSGARQILAAIERAIGQGDERARPLLAPVHAEIAVAAAEDDIAGAAPDFDPLFRLAHEAVGRGRRRSARALSRPRSAGTPDRIRRGRVDLPHDACRRSPVEAARPGAQLPGRLRAIGRRAPRTASRRGKHRRISRRLRRYP